MLTKDRRRAERRHRSYSTWMRRLKRDWDEHRGPWTPKYTWEDGVCTFSPGDRTQRCKCYNLLDPQALRFKDTPNNCGCWSCANPRRTYRNKNKMALTFQEQRAFLDDREDWSKKKPNGERLILVRTICICGYLMEKVWKCAKDISWRDRHSENYCPSCEKRFGPRKRIRMPA